MEQNLDVIISFVVIIAGLSMLLQIVMEVVKNFLGLKWGVYETYLVSLYKNHFIDDVAPIMGDKALWRRVKQELKKERVKGEIGSISDRFKNLNTKTVLLAEVLMSIRSGLLKLQQDTAGKSNDEFRQIIRQKCLNSEIDEVKQAINRAQSMDVARLFGIYLKVHSTIAVVIRESQPHGELDKIATNLENVSQNIQEFGPTLSRVNSLLAELEQMQRVISSSATEAYSMQLTDSILDDLRLKLDEVVALMAHYEHFVGGLRNKFEANIDNWRGELEKSYSKNIVNRSFFMGFLLVAALNADTFTIYSALNSDAVLRERVMAQSAAIVDEIKVISLSSEINVLNDNAKIILNGKTEVSRFALEQFIADYRALNQAFEDEALYLSELSAGYRPTVKGNTPNPIEPMENLLATGTIIPLSEIKSSLYQAMAGLTHSYVQMNTDVIKSQTEKLMSTAVPLGWNQSRFDALFRAEWSAVLDILLKLLSFVLTAVLISFGSSFWNDLLKSLLGLKGFMKNANR